MKLLGFACSVILSIFVLHGAILAAEEYSSDLPETKLSTSQDINEPVKFSLNNALGEDIGVNLTGRLTENYIYAKAGVEKKNVFMRGVPHFIGVDVNSRSWNEGEFDLAGAGVDFYIGRGIDDFTSGALKYRLDRTEVANTDPRSDLAFRRYDTISVTSAVSLELTRSTLDDGFYPTSGTLAMFLSEYALKFLGSEYSFFKYEISGAYFATPFWDITLGAHAKLGVMEDFGNNCEDVPFFERFFAGSSSTVRGFRWGKAGALSAQGAPLGGDVLFTTNLEARIPIYKKLKGVVFFDMGRTVEKWQDLFDEDLRESSGLGLRYLTPWVALRADYGFIINKKSGEAPGRLHLTLGMPF